MLRQSRNGHVSCIYRSSKSSALFLKMAFVLNRSQVICVMFNNLRLRSPTIEVAARFCVNDYTGVSEVWCFCNIIVGWGRHSRELHHALVLKCNWFNWTRRQMLIVNWSMKICKYSCTRVYKIDLRYTVLYNFQITNLLTYDWMDVLIIDPWKQVACDMHL